jgi:hypothetical protein
LPSGDYLFVITDEYSRYPIVEIIKWESEFARGYDGVTRRSLNPMFSTYCRNAYELNGDPFSVLMTFGIPKVNMTVV